MREFVDYAVEDVRAKVGDKRVLLALSGGVDSSTLAFFCTKRSVKILLACLSTRYSVR